jgi:protein SCO1/2
VKKALLLFFILIFPSAIYVILTVGKERTFVLLPYYGPKKPIQLNVNGKMKKDTVYYQIPYFKFRDQDGKPINAKTFSGKIWVACFVHLADKNITPSMAILMNRVEERTNLDSTIRLVTFALDSETSKSMQDYSAMVHAGKKRIFLSGNAQEMNQFAIDAFYKPVDTAYSNGFTHFFLIDKEGCIRGIYNALRIKDTDKLIDEISMLETFYYIKNEKKEEKQRDKDEAI